MLKILAACRLGAPFQPGAICKCVPCLLVILALNSVHSVAPLQCLMPCIEKQQCYWMLYNCTHMATEGIKGLSWGHQLCPVCIHTTCRHDIKNWDKLNSLFAIDTYPRHFSVFLSTVHMHSKLIWRAILWKSTVGKRCSCTRHWPSTSSSNRCLGINQLIGRLQVSHYSRASAE